MLDAQHCSGLGHLGAPDACQVAVRMGEFASGGVENIPALTAGAGNDHHFGASINIGSHRCSTL
ncbi:hypothetical protein D3C72_2358780 [compost metagenome]